MTSVFSFDSQQVSLAAGIEFGVVVGLSLLVSSLAFSPTVGVLVAAGALNAASVVAKKMTRPRIAMMTATLALSVAGFLGSVTAHAVAVRLLLLAVLSVSLGLYVKAGAYGTAIGNQAVIGFVVFGRFPRAPEIAAAASSAVIIGGLVQVALFAIVPLVTTTGRRSLRAAAPVGFGGLPRRSREFVRANYARPLDAAVWHAIRLATAMELAEGVSLVYSEQRGYWAALTVAIVLRPDWPATRIRGIQRLVGTLLGAGMVGLAVDLWNPGWISVGLALAVVGSLMFSIHSASYVLYTAFLSAAVVLLLTVIAKNGVLTAADRVVFTAVGGGIAFAVQYVLHPRSLVVFHRRAETSTTSVLTRARVRARLSAARLARKGS